MSAATLPPEASDEEKGRAREIISGLECSVRGVTAITQDHREVPLDKCSWVQTASCGCMSAITMAVCAGEVLTSAEAAQRALSVTKKDAAQQVAQGFRMHLTEHKVYADVLLPLFLGTCPHDPQWGYTRPSKVAQGVTFQRFNEREWSATRPSGEWRIEKHSGTAWYLWPPHPLNGRSVEYLDRVIGKAIDKAATLILTAERAS